MSIIFNPGEPINNGIQSVNNGLSENPLGNAQLGGPDLVQGGLTQFTAIPLDGQTFYIGDASLTPNGGVLFFLGGKQFAFESLIGTILSAISVASGGTNGLLIGVGIADPNTGQVSTVQNFEITGHAMQIRDETESFGMDYIADYSAKGLLSDRWIPDLGAIKKYLTPLAVDDSLGIFTNADCNAALPNAGPGQELQGLTVIYKNVSANTWVNYPYTACL